MKKYVIGLEELYFRGYDTENDNDLWTIFSSVAKTFDSKEDAEKESFKLAERWWPDKVEFSIEEQL